MASSCAASRSSWPTARTASGSLVVQAKDLDTQREVDFAKLPAPVFCSTTPPYRTRRTSLGSVGRVRMRAPPENVSRRAGASTLSKTIRSALEGGARTAVSTARTVRTSSGRPWSRPCSTASSLPGSYGASSGRRPLEGAVSLGRRRSGRWTCRWSAFSSQQLASPATLPVGIDEVLKPGPRMFSRRVDRKLFSIGSKPRAQSSISYEPFLQALRPEPA